MSTRTAPVPRSAGRASTPDQTPAARREARRAMAGRAAVRVLSLAVLLGVWWLVATLDVWPDLFVPDPSAVWQRFIESESTHDGQVGLSGYYLHQHLWASLVRIATGVGAAIVFGVALGLALAMSKRFQVIVEP